MRRLSKEEYREAKGCLKRYNYNCINIINIQRDILNISVAPCDGLPKAPYSVGDNTLNKVIKLEENEELQKSIREYKAVIQALSLVNYESKVIFEREFRESKYKWDVIDELNKSEETYKRRKRELIYAVHKELNKTKLNLQP
jgi:hypothetical protein